MSNERITEIENRLRSHALAFERFAKDKSDKHDWSSEIVQLMAKKKTQAKPKQIKAQKKALRYIPLGFAAAISLIFWNFKTNNADFQHQMETNARMIIPLNSIAPTNLQIQLDAVIFQQLQQEQQALNHDMLEIKASFKL